MEVTYCPVANARTPDEALDEELLRDDLVLMPGYLLEFSHCLLSTSSQATEDAQTNIMDDLWDGFRQLNDIRASWKRKAESDYELSNPYFQPDMTDATGRDYYSVELGNLAWRKAKQQFVQESTPDIEDLVQTAVARVSNRHEMSFKVSKGVTPKGEVERDGSIGQLGGKLSTEVKTIEVWFDA